MQFGLFRPALPTHHDHPEWLIRNRTRGVLATGYVTTYTSSDGDRLDSPCNQVQVHRLTHNGNERWCVTRATSHEVSVFPTRQAALSAARRELVGGLETLDELVEAVVAREGSLAEVTPQQLALYPSRWLVQLARARVSERSIACARQVLEARATCPKPHARPSPEACVLMWPQVELDEHVYTERGGCSCTHSSRQRLQGLTLFPHGCARARSNSRASTH